MNRFKKIYLLLLLPLFILAFWFFNQSKNLEPTSSPTPTTQAERIDYISYPGKAGVDALTLLKESAQIRQDNSGLVVSINGREAKSEDREYWSFYVNGEPASVGPADYKTKEGDLIEWKVEKY